jgi:hypothetical protein
MARIGKFLFEFFAPLFQLRPPLKSHAELEIEQEDAETRRPQPEVRLNLDSKQTR